MLNLHSHSTSDLSRNHKVLDELTSLVEVTERAAFTTSSARVSPDARAELVTPQGFTGNTGSRLTTAPKSVEYPQNPVAASVESERVLLASAPTQSQPLSEPFTPRVLSSEELAQAEDAFHFDLRSDFDETEFEEEEI